MDYQKNVDPDTMQPVGLFRRDERDDGLYIEKWSVSDQKWVDHPGLAGWASAIGGADDFLNITEAEANDIIAEWGGGNGSKKKAPEEKGGPGSGHWGHAGRPGSRGGSAARSGPGAAAAAREGGIHYGGARTYAEADKAVFAAQLRKMPEEKKPFLTMYSADEYKQMGAKCYLSDTGRSGYALKPDGDIISVFSMPGAKEGKSAIKSAIENGGVKLDCFDGFLAGKFYPQFGFTEYKRYTWDDQYMPQGWNKSKYDSPDVVMMKLGE